MAQDTDRWIGWQGWLWLAILAVCLAALALGLGYRYGTVSADASADPVSSASVGAAVEVRPTIELFPVSTRPRSRSDVRSSSTSSTSARSTGVLAATTVLETSTEWSSSSTERASTERTSTSRPAEVSTTARRPSTVSSTTSRPSTVSSTATTSRSATSSVTTAAAEPVRLQSTAPPSTRPTTSTTQPTTSTTRWMGPVAVDDHVAVDEGKETKPKVLDNDASGEAAIDEDTLTITAAPANAESYRVHGDHLHYRPVDDFVGVDRIGYRICDDAGRCDTATVTITVG